MSTRTKIILVVVGLVALNLAFLFLPLDGAVRWMVRWARRSGPEGMVLFMLVYLASMLLMVPGSLLTAAAGFVYGPFLGAALVLPPSLLGAVLAFALARTVARPWVARRLAHHPKFQALDHAVEARGLSFMMLLRLSPIIPYNILSYALSCTRVRFWQYALSSAVGTLPGTVMFVYLGSAITSLAQLRHPERIAGHGQSALYWVGLAATVAACVVGTRLARRALRDVEAAPAPAPAGEAPPTRSPEKKRGVPAPAQPAREHP